MLVTSHLAYEYLVLKIAHLRVFVANLITKIFNVVEHECAALIYTNVVLKSQKSESRMLCHVSCRKHGAVCQKKRTGP